MSDNAAPLFVTLSQSAPIPLDVAIACRPGELLALVGPSGSGKTTVLRSIAGLYRPAQGCIISGGDTWLDCDTGVMVPPQARSVGLVFQDYALFPHLSALDNVRLAMQHVAEPERSARSKALLARVHLDGLEARTPERLSGGQRQRVAIARALARDPRVLLLDEPFSAVDRTTRERLKDELVSLRRSLEIPIILVTHDLEEAQALADRLSIVHAGRTLQTGTPDDVRLRPESPLVARLMGQTNVFEGEVAQRSTDGQPGKIRWAGGTLHAAETGRFNVGDQVAFLVPPDYIALQAGNSSADDNIVSGVVCDLRSLGEMTVVFARVDNTSATLQFRLPSRQAREASSAPGDRVRLRLFAAGVHLMPRDT